MAIIGLLVWVYTILCDSSLLELPVWQLVKDIIPETVVVLAASVVIHILFYHVGLTPEQRFSAELKNIFSVEAPRFVAKFLKSGVKTVFYNVGNEANWSELIENSNSKIVMISYYLGESWLAHHQTAITNFLKKDGTTLDIYIIDPDDSDALLHTQQVYYLKLSLDELKNKIRKTKKLLRGLCVEHNIPINKVKVKFVPQRLNYNIVTFDKTVCAIGVFENFRPSKGKERSNWPVFIFELDDLPSLKDFINSQITFLDRISKVAP
ncbi:hypothetical protein KDL29_04140 [bacterium]|nr:hypothetical protein [bacterium]